CQKYSYSPCTF
nr:immunoglobulin light chain junction region [Macaca mulatta]MOV36909.1 immunoglobulin light chain junction region [Macaca mulatta]MOV36913.1 immunoglobulin light chain junction region [Macaca mulatta]MOV36923.1 immunoglobulin light chain junction region [Macaca mulatta]MOV36930.1 immunoglobulin light chain junction region [Macaca mulatta]